MPDILEQLQEAYRKGQGLKKLCEDNNLDELSILRQAKLENWGKPNIKKSTNTSPTLSEDTKPKRTPIEKGHSYAERLTVLLERTLQHLEENSEDDPQIILDAIDQIEKLDRVARRSYGLDKEQTGGPTLNVNILAQGIQAFAQVDYDRPPIIELTDQQLQFAKSCPR